MSAAAAGDELVDHGEPIDEDEDDNGRCGMRRASRAVASCSINTRVTAVKQQKVWGCRQAVPTQQEQKQQQQQEQQLFCVC
jgi:hypothetical protein